MKKNSNISLYFRELLDGAKQYYKVYESTLKTKVARYS